MWEINLLMSFYTQASRIYQHLDELSHDVSYLQMKEFTMQINYHQKFIYTAYNFFTIDYSLLFSVGF